LKDNEKYRKTIKDYKSQNYKNLFLFLYSFFEQKTALNRQDSGKDKVPDSLFY